jgi:hypothetical protein
MLEIAISLKHLLHGSGWNLNSSVVERDSQKWNVAEGCCSGKNLA